MVEREQDRESIALPYCGCESVFCGTDDDRNRRYLVGIIEKREVTLCFIFLPNVKSGGTAAQDSQSEANEGRCPALPPTYCSAFILSASQTLTMD